MTRHFAGYWVLLFSMASSAAIWGGCGSNDGSPGDGGSLGDGSLDARGGEDSGGARHDAGSDADRCLGGTLCGSPAQCCPAGNECVDGECLVTCETGVRCGPTREICCDAGDLCLADQCAAPGNDCADSYDCEQPGQFCEPTLDRCLPQPDPLNCERVPTFAELDVTIEWSFEDDEIISIPVVADLDGDGRPEVVVNVARQDGGGWPRGNILVLAGDSGDELLRIPHDPTSDRYGSHGRATIAVGDVSGDGLPDIVYPSRPSYGGRSLLVAVDHEGSLLWTSHDSDGSNHTFALENGAVTLASFDGDPQAEAVAGASLIDDDGLVVWDEGGDGARYGTNSGYVGGISAVADLDGDGAPEILSGRDAWAVSWTDGDPPTVDVSSLWTYPGNDGYPAIADLDENGRPEVVLVASGRVITLDGQTGELWCGVDPSGAACASDPSMRTQPLAIPGGSSGNRGGPPTIADFDADGRPEIGVAGGHAYSVYDINRPSEDIVQPDGDPVPDPGAIFVRWSQATQDLSSNATGSSVFDFQGDGAAEVVYGDECHMRVYSGTDGTIQLEIPSTSATIHEYPLVVDVDADGNSEILIVANDAACVDGSPRWGLFVYGDANDEWVPTRRVWTQHTYHVTNATSSGNVPTVEQDNWTTSGLNNYRQNVQGEGVFNAPDLTVDLSVGLDACAEGDLTLIARVVNEGALGVPAGVEAAFYEGTDATGTLLGTRSTMEPLLPGGSTAVTLAVPAPEEERDYFVEVDGARSIAECDDSNNADATTEANCFFLE